MIESFWDQILNLRIELLNVTTNFYNPTEKSIVITKSRLTYIWECDIFIHLYSISSIEFLCAGLNIEKIRQKSFLGMNHKNQSEIHTGFRWMLLRGSLCGESNFLCVWEKAV